jgi:S1-C subfamily serine protease
LSRWGKRLGRSAVTVAVCLVMTGLARAEFAINDVDDSVVRIQHVLEKGGQRRFGGHGTGFVINSEGYVVTNFHVVDTSRLSLPAGVKVRFVVPDGDWKNLRTAEVKATFPAIDLAILQVKGLSRPPVKLSEVDPNVSPKKGEKVFAVGFPGAADASAGSALHSTLTSGLVGKVFMGRGSSTQTERPVIQHEAGISPGSSGGPLFNDCNEVVGVNTFVATSRFEISREGGRVVARGAAVSGVYYSPHISSLITVLKEKGIAYTGTSEICRSARPGQDPMIFVYIGVAVVLAAVSLLLALRKPRERVVKVVETYSQMLRRKGHEGTSGGVAARKARSAQPEVPTLQGKPLWVLTGTDGAGKAVRFTLTDVQLGRAKQGLVIGRQQGTSDLVLLDESVSRRHARIVLEPDGTLSIEDLGSANGTRLNGQLLGEGSREPVSDGAHLELGDVNMTLSRA